jgi:hypothetical protein
MWTPVAVAAQEGHVEVVKLLHELELRRVCVRVRRARRDRARRALPRVELGLEPEPEPEPCDDVTHAYRHDT